MTIEQWWPNLNDATQAWLIAHNGEALPASVIAEIVAAGGVATSESTWVAEVGPDGLLPSDEAVDWIEAAANDEV
ncbi:hypothetical protein [Agreia bicolorata]|uniref:Uncharacterized protein n=1 Tax=Agreia bicolorata TaxID=110935 RepID=A0ABR5CDH6_9MICO|nr:hypothetical protein [Agreia bicolorata]KJC63547.1 hypothetical protein TZ00_13390 [Agreia bicolorata]